MEYKSMKKGKISKNEDQPIRGKINKAQINLAMEQLVKDQ